MPGDLVIGIDLGTTTSCAAIYRNNQIEVIPTKTGARTTPSVVCFPDKQTRLVGEEAKAASNLSTRNYENCIYGAKRLIGRSVNDPTIEQDRKIWPYEVQLEGGRPMIKISNRSKPLLVEEISAAVLSSLKQDAENYLGEPVNKCVITVPAYFTGPQRAATIAAGKIAGFDVQRIINEPTAGSYAYSLTRTLKQSGPSKIFIFDLGGGTFDMSILHVEKGQFNVLATQGDSHLGGEDIDMRLLSWFLQELNKQHGIRFEVGSPDFTPVKHKIRRHIEQFKHAFASQTKVELTIPSITTNAQGQWVDLSVEMSRAKFDTQICGAFVEKCIAPIQDVLEHAKLTKEEIDVVLLVGGSTRLPKIREELGRFFPPEKISKEINPDEAVAHGAAILAGLISTVPQQRPEGIHVNDITSFTIGVALAKDGFSPLIPKSSPTPCTFSKSYTTHKDNQPRLRFVIYEGEQPQASQNTKLAELTIPLPAESKAGEITVDVAFAINSDGMLVVTAKNQHTGEEQKIEVQYTDIMNTDDLAAFVKEEEFLRSLPLKEQARSKLDLAINICLDTTKGDVGYEIDGVEQEEIVAIIGKAQEAKNWLTSIDFFDVAITPQDFQKYEKAIKNASQDAFAILEEEFYAPQ